MGTIDQPKPTQPKSPVPEQRPLQPGGSDSGSMNTTPATRVRSEAPEVLREEFDEVEEAAHRLHKKP
jgi:hypothetical protein